MPARSSPPRPCRSSRTARSCRRVVTGRLSMLRRVPGRRRRRDHAVELPERAGHARRRAGARPRQRRRSSSPIPRRRSAAARCSRRSSARPACPTGCSRSSSAAPRSARRIVTDPNVTRSSRSPARRRSGGASARSPASCSRRSRSSSAATTRSSSSTTPTSRRRPRPARSRRSSSRARSASRPGATSSIASVADAYVDLLAEKAQRLRARRPVPRGRRPRPDRQREAARPGRRHRPALGRRGGARVVDGGTHDGLFYRPTVLDRRDDRARRRGRDEIFGPVAPVIGVRHRRRGGRARQRQRVRAGRRASTRARSRAAWRSPQRIQPGWSTSTTRR